MGLLESAMNSRLHKAHVIAASGTIVSYGGLSFAIPTSRDRSVFHLVTADSAPDTGTCSCPDAKGGRKCKHVLAVWIAIKHHGAEVLLQLETGSQVEGVPYTKPIAKRVRAGLVETFDDDYAGGRRRERVTIIYAEGEPTEAARRIAAARATPTRLPQLGAQLCRLILPPTIERRRGGQALPLSDQLFSILMKAYNSCSYEELVGQLHLYKESGYARHVPSRNSLVNYQHSSAVNAALKDLLARSALPVRDIETMIAIDGTGFGTCATANPRDEQYRGITQRATNKFMKATASVGCATNMVAAVAFCTEQGAEINYFDQVIVSSKTIWPRASVVLGDALYSDNPRISAASAAGFRLVSPTRYSRGAYQTSDDARWLWDFYNQSEQFTDCARFDDVYRYRSKIESVFSAVKRTMGWHLRMRLANADLSSRGTSPDWIGLGRENELLARFIVWNLRVLVLLEKLHDQTVDFALETRFRPIALERLSAYHPLAGEPLKLPEVA